MAETTNELQQMLASFSPEQQALLADYFKPKRKAAEKASESAELTSAKESLAKFEAEHSDIIEEYQLLVDEVKRLGPKRTFSATRRYTFDVQTGVITSQDGEVLGNYAEKGWQAAMRADGYTPGQVAAVSKKQREHEKGAQEAAAA